MGMCRHMHHYSCYTLHMQIIYPYQNKSPAPCPGRGASTAYSPNAAFRFAYGSVVVIWRIGESLAFAKPASSSSSSSSSPALASRSSNPPSMPVSVSGGNGGACFKVLSGSGDGPPEVAPGSIGPGPATTMGPDTGTSRWTETRSCLDNAFSAGESTSALPAAPRINVCSDKENEQIRLTTGEGGQMGTVPYLWVLVIDAAQ
jgi:hypothetical protein